MRQQHVSILVYIQYVFQRCQKVATWQRLLTRRPGNSKLPEAVAPAPLLWQPAALQRPALH